MAYTYITTGARYRKGAVKLLRSNPTITGLRLSHEADNEHDPYAVAVYLSTKRFFGEKETKVGYLKKGRGENLIDADIEVVGLEVSADDDRDPYLLLEIEFHE